MGGLTEDRLQKDRLRKRTKQCTDCGQLCTGQQCKLCIRKRSTKHGTPSGYKKGCRCDSCKTASRAYGMKATCTDCGKPCQGSKPQRGWIPPKYSRCRKCYSHRCRSKSKTKTLCACGNPKRRTAIQCRTCYNANCRPTGSRKPGQPGPVNRERRLQAAPGLTRWGQKRLFTKWHKQGRVCIYCNGPLECLDHIHPLALGGTNYEGNLAPSCNNCNNSKGGQFVIAWRRNRKLKTRLTPVPEWQPKPRHRPKNWDRPMLPILHPCHICGNWAKLPEYYCSPPCRTEFNARLQRDLYRRKQGKPVDPSKPTKPWIRNKRESA
jgi:HNH endonuclease